MKKRVSKKVSKDKQQPSVIVTARPVAKEPTAKKAAQAGGKPTADSAAGKQPRASLLNLAAQVLAKSKQPLSCKELVTMVMANHGWTSSGKTPEATLYAAIIREISKKGEAARFVKSGPGKFRMSNIT